jgi:2-methylcitrate dehydratase PrpD
MSTKIGVRPSVIDEIANYTAKLEFEDLTELAVLRTRQVVLDYLGITIGGYQTRLGGMTTEYAATVRSGTDASMIADGRCSSLDGAAWANAVMSCILGMSDSHRRCGHVASEVVSVALAVGEHRCLSGREVMTAIAAGYDVFGAIQPAVKDVQRERGLDHKSQVGTLASAIVAGKLMGLDAAGLGHALALSVEMACGTEQYTFDAGRSDTEGLVAGLGASNGISAARMANFGFRGSPGALDGQYGYFHAFGNGYDPKYLATLGKSFAVAGTGFKPHSGCRHVHPCVDATQDLLKTGRPPLDQIVSIEIGTYEGAITPSFRINPEPNDVDAAGYSLPATVAVVLALGSWYREDIEAYDRPECRRLWPLVTAYLDEELEEAYPQKNGCRVKVVTQDGSAYEGQVEYARGEPESMLTDAELEFKFRRLIGDFLPAGRIDQIIEMAYRLEELENVGELVRLTAKS